MHAGLEIHNECLRKCIAENHGYEVKTVGDSFVVAFRNVPDAAAFMLRAQHALLEQPWSNELLPLPNCEPLSAASEDKEFPKANSGEISTERRSSTEDVVANILKSRTGGAHSISEPPWLWRGLRVRMGCHVGEVDREYVPITGRVDYFGPPVNMAARVESLAHGGEILVSEACYEALRNIYPESMTCLGVFMFKSITPLFII